MITPIVTEIPRTLDAVGRDTFIAGAGGSMSSNRPLSRAGSARTRSAAQAQIAARAARVSLAATGSGARPLARAA